jgi:hypothetical protein
LREACRQAKADKDNIIHDPLERAVDALAGEVALKVRIDERTVPYNVA